MPGSVNDLEDVEIFADRTVARVSWAWGHRQQLAPSFAEWRAYCEHHFELPRLVRWPSCVRVRMVEALTRDGLSTRGIGMALNLADQTVRADLVRASGEPVGRRASAGPAAGPRSSVGGGSG